MHILDFLLPTLSCHSVHRLPLNLLCTVASITRVSCGLSLTVDIVQCPTLQDTDANILLSFYLPYVRMAAKFAVFFSVSSYRYHGHCGTDKREILHDGTYRSRTCLLPFWGRCPHGIPQIRIFGPIFWPLDLEYLENGMSQRYMSIRA